MDIFNLTKSKLRTSLLQLYFSHPEKEYYLRELERILKQPVAYVRRELLNLEKVGLFKSEFKGRQKYFKLNKDYPLYQEVKKIVSKTIGLEAQLKELLQDVKNIEVAFIFGSFAKNKEDSLSDIDLMILGQPSEDKLISKISKLESKLDREINYHIYSKKDWQKKKKKKDNFIRNILSGQKIFLIGQKDEL